LIFLEQTQSKWFLVVKWKGKCRPNAICFMIFTWILTLILYVNDFKDSSKHLFEKGNACPMRD
jgi:hypothetical protein